MFDRIDVRLVLSTLRNHHDVPFDEHYDKLTTLLNEDRGEFAVVSRLAEMGIRLTRQRGNIDINVEHYLNRINGLKSIW